MNCDVVGLGNALMDALVLTSDESVLKDFGLVRGTSTMMDDDQWQQIYGRFNSHDIRLESGGSCANTIATLGRLGATSVYAGQVGDDALGKVYVDRMQEACGQHAVRVHEGGATGKCLSIVSKHDAERTMATDLGCAVAFEDFSGFYEAMGNAKVAHFTGYTLLGDPMRSLVIQAMRDAKAKGLTVSLDVADPFVVGIIRDLIWELLDDCVDLVFLNAEEARALTGEEGHVAAEHIAEKAKVCSTVVVKVGMKGSVIHQGGELTEVGIYKVDAIDTTGAGDAYAAGYLYGHLQGWSPARSGDLAARVAAFTVAQLGAVVKDRSLLQSALAENA